MYTIKKSVIRKNRGLSTIQESESTEFTIDGTDDTKLKKTHIVSGGYHKSSFQKYIKGSYKFHGFVIDKKISLTFWDRVNILIFKTRLEKMNVTRIIKIKGYGNFLVDRKGRSRSSIKF